MEGRQAANRREVCRQVEVANDRRAGEAQSAGDLRGIENSSLHVGGHGPETAQRFGWNVRAELRDVALRIGANEILLPDRSRFGAFGGEAAGESAADTEPFFWVAVDFQRMERFQFDTGDTAYEGFSGPGEQVD